MSIEVAAGAHMPGNCSSSRLQPGTQQAGPLPRWSRAAWIAGVGLAHRSANLRISQEAVAAASSTVIPR